MIRKKIAGGSLLVLLCFGGSAFAQETTGRLELGCWIGQSKGHVVSYLLRCIEVPGSRVGAVNVEATEIQWDSTEEKILAEVRRLIQAGDSTALDDLLDTGVTFPIARGIWQVYLHTYPSEESWLDQRPEQLARAVFCPERYTCGITMAR